MNDFEKVARTASRFRDAVNARQDSVVRFGNNWKWLCAAMDIVGDSTLAICAAQNRLRQMHSQSLGDRYLTIYGMLQAMILLHDAAEVVEKLVIRNTHLRNTPSSVELHRVRKIIAGHPLNVKIGGTPSVWGITRITVDTPSNLKIYNWGANGHGFTTESVDLFKLGQNHANEVRAVLVRARRVL